MNEHDAADGASFPTSMDAASPGGEEIKLVVWDLDDTLWRGVLSEGEIQPVPENNARVIQLARRGVMNSICSKNELSRAKAVLQEWGLWTYFVFPSIQWGPKGPRIAEILRRIKLQEQHTVVIDDRAANLEEIRFYNPRIRVLSPAEWSRIDCSRIGKPDEDLSRLKSYRLLEEKDRVLQGFEGSNADFLAQCDIRATLTRVTSADSDLDRLVELVNRANQLNFTKRRFKSGVAEIIHHLKRRAKAVYKVGVKDRFGDYGIAGFVSVSNPGDLEHFVFSCRILDMGVERAVFQEIARMHGPLRTSFPGASSLAAPAPWVHLIRSDEHAESARPHPDGRPRMLLLLSCVGNAIAPFLERRFSVHSSHELVSVDAVRCDPWSSLGRPRELRSQLRRLFSGHYSALVMSTTLEVLYPHPWIPPFGRMTYPSYFALAAFDQSPDVRAGLASFVRGGGRLSGPGHAA